MLGSEGADDFEVLGDGRQGRSRPSPPRSKSFHSREPSIAIQGGDAWIRLNRILLRPSRPSYPREATIAERAKVFGERVDFFPEPVPEYFERIAVAV